VSAVVKVLRLPAPDRRRVLEAVAQLARASIGYEPAVGFEDGLRATLAHMRDAKTTA